MYATAKGLEALGELLVGMLTMPIGWWVVAIIGSILIYGALK